VVAGVGCDALEAFVVSADLRHLDCSVDCKHDGVELVEGGLAHDMGDVREAVVIASKGTVCALDIAASEEDRSHHEACDLGDGCQREGETSIVSLGRGVVVGMMAARLMSNHRCLHMHYRYLFL
jgi:hypothetical protein